MYCAWRDDDNVSSNVQIGCLVCADHAKNVIEGWEGREATNSTSNWWCEELWDR
jgi:hypothetical protein